MNGAQSRKQTLAATFYPNRMPRDGIAWMQELAVWWRGGYHDQRAASLHAVAGRQYSDDPPACALVAAGATVYKMLRCRPQEPGVA